MSRPWVPSLYRTHDAQSPPPDPPAVENILQAVNESTKHLRENPYDSNILIERAGYFLTLNYPELAVGDAYKAKLLQDRASNNQYQADDSHKKEARSTAYNILGQALYDCHCHWEAVEFWEDVARKTAGQESKLASDKAEGIRQLLERKKEAAIELGGTPQEKKDRIRDGGVVTVHYPWLHEHNLTRSPDVVKCVNKELRENEQGHTCYLGRSTLASKEDDMLGMFAARDIQEGECILLDRTATGICSNPSTELCDNCYINLPPSPPQASCCSTAYCSTACRDLALTTYHSALCGQDFHWLFDPAKGITHNASPLRPILMLRFLATWVQAGMHTSPLEHPLIARLQPLANSKHLDVFTFAESVTVPLRILQQLGVDVFANPHCDTATLHALWTRIANNKAGAQDKQRGFIDEITPFLPLFNHSCAPNVEWKRQGGGTTVRFFATKRIAQGEELFCSYLDVEHVSLEERVERLWPWFEGPCLCARCKRELAETG